MSSMIAAPAEKVVDVSDQTEASIARLQAFGRWTTGVAGQLYRLLRTFGASVKTKREQLCCLQLRRVNNLLSRLPYPWTSRLSINVLVFFLIRAPGGSLPAPKVRKNPKSEEEPNKVITDNRQNRLIGRLCFQVIPNNRRRGVCEQSP